MNKMIKKIELDLGGKIVSLTPEQAKNLKDALDDLFGERVIREIVREYVPQPYPLPYHPIWTSNPYNPITYDFDNNLTVCDTGTYSFNNGTLRLTG